MPEDLGHNDCWRCSRARTGRLTAAQEGVVEVGWDPEDPRFTKCYLDLHDAARAALKELEEAQK